MTDRYNAYSAGFEAGKEAGRIAALRELGIDPGYKAEHPNCHPMETPVECATQNERILSYLKAGGAITPKDALRLFGSFRLSARIFDLREMGWPIDTQDIQVGPRTWVALFSMERGAKRGQPRKEVRELELAD